MKRLRSIFAMLLYYGWLRHMPSRNDPRAPVVRLRAFVCRALFRSTGKNVNIQKGVYFGKGHKISIGDYSGIGENSILGQSDMITIGDNVLTGPELMIFTQNHNFGDRSIPIRKQGGNPAPVLIQDDVWIGARVIILAGVTIGTGSVVGAGSVVTRDVPPYSVIGGVPAKIIGQR